MINLGEGMKVVHPSSAGSGGGTTGSNSSSSSLVLKLNDLQSVANSVSVKKISIFNKLTL
jgi:hypothetical protein